MGLTRTFKDRRPSNFKGVFCGFRIITKNFALHEYKFVSQSYWHFNFPDLNLIEEVWNIMKEDVSRCLQIYLAHYGRVCGGTNHETV